MKRIFSAGGIIYRAGALWLVRKPKANPGFNGSLGWTFAKGMIDEGETAEQTALREVREEAGVEAKIIKKLPVLKVFYTDEKGEKVMKQIAYYVMEYTGDVPEGFGWETEEVRWVTMEEGLKLLEYSSERKLLEEAAEGR